MKWGVYFLSATISFFIVLLLAVLFMLFKYRKKLKESGYAPVKKQSINFEPCVSGRKKPYIERVVQYLLGYSDAEGGTEDLDDDGGVGDIKVNTARLTKIVPVQPSSDSDLDYHTGTSAAPIRPRTGSYQNENVIPQVGV